MLVIPAQNPVALDFLGIPIYWYGIIMALAIFIAMLVSNKLYNSANIDYRKDIIIEYAPVIIVSGIIGARLYFCALHYDYYLTNFLEIFDLRQGGLSIHGAIMFGVLGMIAVAKRTHVPIMCIMDAMACGTLLGQAIGRWGNYFNSEAYGLPVADQSWGLFIPEARRVVGYADYTLFHPTFLYESLLNIVGFCLLFYIMKKFGAKLRGLSFFSYLCVYSVIRFFIERIRLDSALNVAGGVPIAEVISLVLLLVGACGILCTIIKNIKLKNF